VLEKLLVGFTSLLSVGAFVWFIVFTVIVTVRLNRIIQLLEKKS
jgi:hypothetical protein